MAATIFDHIKAITVTKDLMYWDTLADEDKKSWSNYMVFRFLSMDSDIITTLASLQPLVQELHPRALYMLLCSVLPKSNKYNKYVKPDTAKSVPDWVVTCVSKYFGVSTNTASEYIDILYLTSSGKAEIKLILSYYGHEDKEINKLKL